MRKPVRGKNNFFNKTQAMIIICALLMVIGSLGYLLYDAFFIPDNASSTSAAQSTATSIAQPKPPQPIVTTLKFSASGDNLIHDGLYNIAKTRAGEDEYDFSYLYQNVASFYKDYDINWINQETLISDEIAPSGYPQFCTPGNAAQTLYDIGFRVFAMSNNHSYDQYAKGISSTLDFWSKMPEDVVYTGFYHGESDYDNITMQEKDGVTIAYLAYTESTNGLPTPAEAPASIIYTSQTEVIQRQIELARTKADVVIVCVHMGTENSHDVNAAQRIFGQQAADWGADIIIGTHPHVVQPIEVYTAAPTGKQVPFIYSLGNFVSLQKQADNLIGIIATFDITKTTQPTGESETVIDNIKAIPVVMYYNNTYKDASLYLYRDYTDEIAAIQANQNLSRSFVEKVLRDNISEKYLVL